MGRETIHTYTQDQLETILKTLSSSSQFGSILRAKGILQTPEKTWLHFDLVPGEYEVRVGPACLLYTSIHYTSVTFITFYKFNFIIIFPILIYNWYIGDVY